MLYDAHVHLTDAQYSDYIADILTSLAAMKIVACSVTVDLQTTKKSFHLFSGVDSVRQFVGIHPEFSAREDVQQFKDMVVANIGQVDGVGEIGLDPTYIERGVPYERQKEVFAEMLGLAEALAKPVSIHSRKSLEDIVQILPSYRLKGALLHWFAGSKKQLSRCMDMGLYVSFGPALVTADDKKVLLKHCKQDRILVETDGPVRFPRCFEDKPALPTSCLVTVVANAASVLGKSYEETVALLQKNTESFLS